MTQCRLHICSELIKKNKKYKYVEFGHIDAVRCCHWNEHEHWMHILISFNTSNQRYIAHTRNVHGIDSLFLNFSAPSFRFALYFCCGRRSRTLGQWSRQLFFRLSLAVYCSTIVYTSPVARVYTIGIHRNTPSQVFTQLERRIFVFRDSVDQMKPKIKYERRGAAYQYCFGRLNARKFMIIVIMKKHIFIENKINCQKHIRNNPLNSFFMGGPGNQHRLLCFVHDNSAFFVQ